MRKRNNRKHISFSEIKIWQECPYKHKLSYIDDLRMFKGNEFTAFGKALHAVSEKFLVEETEETPSSYFEKQFLIKVFQLYICQKKALQQKAD